MKRLLECLRVFALHTSLFTYQLYAQTSTAIANTGLSVINVTNYGAKGDGSADDTAAITAAMTGCITKAIPNSGCVLYFPAGVYLTSGLALQSFVHMKGDGWGTSVIQLKPNTAVMF